MLEVVKNVAEATTIPFTVGGGISDVASGRTGVIMGTMTKTPVLLMLELRPLKNLRIFHRIL